MASLASDFEKLLPHWFEETQLQWVQWVYAFWQIVRCNPLTLLVLSFLPYYVSQWRKRKRVVVLGETKDYDMPDEEMYKFLERHPLKNLDIIRRERLTSGSRSFHFYWVKHCEYFYMTHENTLRELAKCSKELGEEIIFVESLLTITATLSVGKKLSQTEAYEMVLSKRYHCSKGTDCVVPTWVDYADLSSKFWGVLCTIPILLQAKGYDRFSNLLSVGIILLDINRRWLYNIYSALFDSFVKWVKLNVFKERTAFYSFFSIFSSRWRYCDTVKKHAYVALPGDVVNLRCYSKLESVDDLEIVGWKQYTHDTNDQNICMEIVKDKGHWSLIQYNEEYAEAKLKKPVYVSDHTLNVHVPMSMHLSIEIMD